MAVYWNGLYAANMAQVARQFPKARIFTIDVLGTAPEDCGIADVENRDMTPADIPGWVNRRIDAHPDALARIYCNKSTWPAAQREVVTLAPAQRERVRWWIADPTGTDHGIPGADAVQWDWGVSYDTSSILRSFVSA